MTIALMMPTVSEHWTDAALCEGDERFTQDATLTDEQRMSLEAICRECPVFFQCLDLEEQRAIFHLHQVVLLLESF